MIVEDWGLVEYREAWARQLEVVDRVIAGGEDTLVLLEHPSVLTLGSSFHESNLLLSARQYASLGIDIVQTDRGGDVTYHGPGQLVAYPIFNVSNRGRDLHAWLRSLEEVFIQVCGDYGLVARRFPPNTGVWIDDLKVAAIGIKVKKWVSLHGIALNCDNDLSPFDLIVPCGIEDYGVTSLSEARGHQITVAEAKTVVAAGFK